MIDLTGIRNIIFDMGAVLLPVTRERCLDEFARLGFEDAARCVGTSYKDGIFEDFERGLISESAFVDAVLARCSPGTSPDQVVETWNHFIAPIPVDRLNLVLRLKQRFRVLLLSNTNVIHWHYVCEHDFLHDGVTVDDHFEQCYLSFEMHVTKPDASIFTRMIDASGIVPGQSLFIDDAQKNCDVARSLGIQAYCADTDGKWMELFQ